MEATFVNTNAAATLKLGQARGIAMLVPASAGLTVAEYAPNLVKKTIVGAGHGEKAQIRMMIGVLLPKADPQSDDAADALAIAICHAHHRQSVAVEGSGAMIGKLKGIIDSYGEDFVILDVGRRRLSGALLGAHAAAACRRPASRRRCRSKPMCARTRSNCSALPPTPSANGSACCRPCRASARGSRSRCSARSSRPNSPPRSRCATRRRWRARPASAPRWPSAS